MMKAQTGSDPIFDFHDPEDYCRLQELLASSGYMDSRVLDSIGISDLPAIKENDHPLLLQRTSSNSPLHILVRLFLMETAVNRDIVQKVIRPMSIDSWQKAGLVRCQGEDVFAAVKLLPFQDLILAFDLPSIMQTPLREQYVMGVGSSTITLSNLTLRRRFSRTLDLGSGCGVHAFLASRHSKQCLGVDLNPRAVKLAAFNAKLNNITNCEFLQGDFFTPIAGQQFDLVVSNPPFVISPETRFIYRDGGMEADAVTRQIVNQVPPFLNDGGYCQILCNWAQIDGTDWKERLASWFEDTGCDAWIMRSESLTAATYASTWIRHTEFFDQETPFGERFDRWMAYYEKLGIESMGAGLITMRKSSNCTPWFRADESPEKMIGPCGESIETGFALQDFLETAKDDDFLLASRLRYNPDLRLEQHFEPTEQGWKAEASYIHLAKGFAYTGSSDPLIANLMLQCNGKKSFNELIPDMALTLGVSAEKLGPTVCSLIRRLVQQGFLLPA